MLIPPKRRGGIYEQQEPPFFSVEQQQLPTPNFFKMISNGQKFVKDDCSKLKPTNAVNQSQFGV
jgi:hypothetical protein